MASVTDLAFSLTRMVDGLTWEDVKEFSLTVNDRPFLGHNTGHLLCTGFEGQFEEGKIAGEVKIGFVPIITDIAALLYPHAQEVQLYERKDFGRILEKTRELVEEPIP